MKTRAQLQDKLDEMLDKVEQLIAKGRRAEARTLLDQTDSLIKAIEALRSKS